MRGESPEIQAAREGALKKYRENYRAWMRRNIELKYTSDPKIDIVDADQANEEIEGLIDLGEGYEQDAKDLGIREEPELRSVRSEVLGELGPEMNPGILKKYRETARTIFRIEKGLEVDGEDDRLEDLKRIRRGIRALSESLGITDDELRDAERDGRDEVRDEVGLKKGEESTE